MSNPADTPVTIPPPVIEAFPLLTLHVPPPPSLNDVVRPTQTISVPEIGNGVGYNVTVTGADVAEHPNPLVIYTV